MEDQLAQRHRAVRGRLQHHVHASLLVGQLRRCGCRRRRGHRLEHRQPLQQRGERLPHPFVPAELVGFGGRDLFSNGPWQQSQVSFLKNSEGDGDVPRAGSRQLTHPSAVVRVLLRPRLQLLGDLHGEDVALAGSTKAGAVLAALALEHPVPQGSSLVSARTARHADGNNDQ